MGDAEPGRNENAFRFRTDSEKRQVIAKESRKVLNLVPAFETLNRANGMSDIEGKAARVVAMECG